MHFYAFCSVLLRFHIAKANGDLRKVIAAYKKVDLLILDEWLIRCLTPNETYNLPEIIEARIERPSGIS